MKLLPALVWMACTAASFGPAQASDGSVLGADTAFSRNWSPDILEAGLALGLRDFRVGSRWHEVELAPGEFDFSAAKTSFPARIGERGATMSVTVNWGHPFYDKGDTPHSDRARGAFARFAAALATQFPGVVMVEVGNEFNGGNFIRGRIKDAPFSERPAFYARLLADTYEAVKTVRPEVRVLGGAAHSIPAGFLWNVLDAGGAGHMDAIALHPYTTDAEQFARELAVLRRHEAAEALPVHVTEFGSRDPNSAPSYFLRMFSAMAGAGVERAVWYPLEPRSDDMTPLVDAAGRPTPVGEAVSFAAGRLAGRPARDVSPDPFTYATRFGADTMVVWGEPRALMLAEGVEARDALGRRLDPPPAEIGPEPIILVHSGGGDIEAAVSYGSQRLVADSYHQFAYPEPGDTHAAGDGFERFARISGRDEPLVTRPGQENSGEVWTPSLGLVASRAVRVSADAIVPGMDPDGPIELIHRHVVQEAGALDLRAFWDVGENSTDGVNVEIALNGARLTRSTFAGRWEIDLRAIAVAAGDVIEIVFGPNADASGDGSDFRITLTRAE